MISKIFTGYTKRFGSLSSLKVPTVFNSVQKEFSDSIKLAKRGRLPGVNVNDDKAAIRPFLRSWIGFRHKSEDILKTLHDAYLKYKRELPDLNDTVNDARLSMHSFFASGYVAEARAKAKLRAGEDAMFDEIQASLNMA